MKYRDPETGEFKELYTKAADTLPVGTIVDYEGTEVPAGWELVETLDADIKRIKKKEPSIGILGKIINSFSSSKQDTYSADYINNALEEHYSTEETFTGKYWIDGKKIYRKVISMSIPITEVDESIVYSEVEHNIENIDTFYIKNSFFIDNQGVSFSLPAVTMGTTTNKVRVDLTKDVLRIYNSVSYWSGFTLYAVIEYTKTTD